MRLLKHLFLAGALVVVGCGENDADDEVLRITGVGTAEVSIPLEISEITDVIATVSAPDIVPPVTARLAIVGNVATGLVAGIPAGLDRTFSISAFVNAVLVCTGTEVVEIVADSRVTVGVTLDCSIPPPESGEAEVVAGFNFPPTISAVTATPSSVLVGGTVAMEVVASDPDGDPLTYLWAADDGAFDVTDAAAVMWTAPAVAGDYVLTIEVSDGTATVALSVMITVVP